MQVVARYDPKRSNEAFILVFMLLKIWLTLYHDMPVTLSNRFCQDYQHFLFLIDKQESETVFVHVQYTLMRHNKPLLLPSCKGDRTGCTGYGFPPQHTSQGRGPLCCFCYDWSQGRHCDKYGLLCSYRSTSLTRTSVHVIVKH